MFDNREPQPMNFGQFAVMKRMLWTLPGVLLLIAAGMFARRGEVQAARGSTPR